MAKGLPVVEIFGPTIQGEGAVAGMPTYFIRLGGCDYRCIWCDSMHAVDPYEWTKTATWMQPDEIITAIKALPEGPQLISLSGGNPAIWECMPLVQALHMANYKVCVETQASIFRPWLREADLVTLSPKPPSAGNVTKIDIVKKFLLQLTDLGPVAAPIKVVIKDNWDLEYANELAGEVGTVTSTMYLQPMNQHVNAEGDPSYEEMLSAYKDLITRAQDFPHLQNAIVLPQLHVLLWGNQRGV